jgi:hypothetical protein
MLYIRVYLYHLPYWWQMWFSPREIADMEGFVSSLLVMSLLVVLLWKSSPKPPPNMVAIEARIRTRRHRHIGIKQELILWKQDLTDILY